MGIDPVSPTLTSAAIASDRLQRSNSEPHASASPVAEVPQARPIEINASYGESNIIIYRILDKETGDLIQQIPPEQLLAIARSVRELLKAKTENAHLDVRS